MFNPEGGERSDLYNINIDIEEILLLLDDYFGFKIDFPDIFEKDNTTKYKKRQKKVRDIEFMEVSQSALVEDLNLDPVSKQDITDVLEIEPKKVIKLKKGRKLKPTIFLEEEEEDIAVAPAVEETDLSEFEIELPPSGQKPKKRKTKRKQANIKFNPPGKTKKNVHFSV